MDFLFTVGENVVSKSYVYPVGFFGTDKEIKVSKQCLLHIQETCVGPGLFQQVGFKKQK